MEILYLVCILWTPIFLLTVHRSTSESDYNSSFFSTPQNMDWFEGKRYCDLNHGRMLTIETQGQYDYIMDKKYHIIFSSGPAVWIGLYMGSAVCPNYVWTNGNPFNWAEWNFGEPKCADDVCGMLTLNGFHKAICSSKMTTICVNVTAITVSPASATKTQVAEVSTTNFTTAMEVTNVSTTNATTVMGVTNVSTTNVTTAMEVTNVSTTNATTVMGVTNASTTNVTTAMEVTNVSTTNATTAMGVTNVSTTNVTTAMGVTNVSTTNVTTAMGVTIVSTTNVTTVMGVTNVSTTNVTTVMGVTMSVATANQVYPNKTCTQRQENFTRLSHAELLDAITELKKKLYVSKNNTSTYRRKRISVFESRPSSIVMGGVACAIIAVVVSCIVVPDVIVACTFLCRYINKENVVTPRV